MSKITLEVNKTKFNDLLDKLSELQKIGDIVKMKISSKEILMYSLKGESSILAFKNYTLPTTDFFTFKEDFECTYDLIIGSISKFIKTAKFFDLASEEKLQFILTSKASSQDEKIMQVRGAQLKDKKFKFAAIISEPFKIRDINKKMLSQILNMDNEQWHFNVKRTDLDNIKKMAAIYSENEIVNITTKDGQVDMNQAGSWNLNVDTIEEKGDDLSFAKEWMKLINLKEDIIKFSIFDRFILMKEGEMNLMIAFELTYD